MCSVKSWRGLPLKAPVEKMELLSGPLRRTPGKFHSMPLPKELTGAARDSARRNWWSVYAHELGGKWRLSNPGTQTGRRRGGGCMNCAWTLHRSVRGVGCSGSTPQPLWLLDEPLPLPPPEILQGAERIESRLVGRQGCGARLLCRASKLGHLAIPWRSALAPSGASVRGAGVCGGVLA